MNDPLKYLCVLAFVITLVIMPSFAQDAAPQPETQPATPTTQPAVPPATLPETTTAPPAPTGFTEPKVTPIPGGYFLEWPRLTEIDGVQLSGPLAGRFTIQFDLRPEDVGKEPEPVTDPEVLLPLADYWIARGNPARAIPLYRKGLHVDPTNLIFLNNLAMLLSSVENKHAEALRILDNVLAEQRDNVSLLDTKGLVLMKDGRASEAVPLFERAVELSCQLPIYCMHLAKGLDATGQEDSARNWFEKARPLLESSPSQLGENNKGMFDELRGKYGPSVE